MYRSIISCPLNQTPQIPFSSNHRYDLTTPSLDNSSLSAYAIIDDRQFFELLVIDNQPQNQSTLDQNLDKVSSFEPESLMAVGIPHLAFTYLTLTEYNPIIPELLDAWIDEDNQQEIVIISIEPESKNFIDYIEQNQLEIVQVITLLQTTVKLWKSFLKINCCNTLLYPENIRVSSQGKLIIEKLYLDNSQTPLIRELVETWATLLIEQDEQYEDLITQLMTKIESGQIEQAKQLKQELQILSQEIQLQSILEEQEDLSLEEGLDLDSINEDSEYNTIAEQLDYEESSFAESEATQINQDLDDQPTIVLPMKLLSVKEVGLTDIGKRRGHNEDNFALETHIHRQETSHGTSINAKGLFIVCDGMGGHASGEVASAMAVKHLRNYFEQNWDNQLPDSESITEGVLLANEVLYSLNTQKGQTGSGRMGTTLVMGLLKDNQVAIAHVGDSRAYKVTRKSGLELLTIDHCVAQTEIKQGVAPEIAYNRPDAFQLTQALGPRDNTYVLPEVTFFDIKEDTLLLMCSDGLYDNNLLESNYQELLLPLLSSSQNLDEGIAKIIELGNEVNGHDNLTCVLVRIKVQPNLENQFSLL